jgi:O-antigen ligase
LWIPAGLDARFVAHLSTLLQMFALFLISANVLEDAEFRGALMRAYGWWVSLVAVGMLLGIVGGQFTESQGRTSILGQDPNVAAGFFAAGAISLAADLGKRESRYFAARLFLGLLAICALIVAILQTASRGGLLVFVAGILGLVLCGGKATRMRRAAISLAVIAALGVLVAREFAKGSLAATRMTGSFRQGDTAGRTTIYDAAWAMFLKKPLMGYGGANNYSMLGVYLNDPHNAPVNSKTNFKDTHNLLLAILTEVGLVGALPFVGAIFLALWNAWRYGRLTDDALPFALLCAQITMNVSLTGYRQKLFWIVLGGAVAAGLELESARKTGARGMMPPDRGDAGI